MDNTTQNTENINYWFGVFYDFDGTNPNTWL